MGKYQALHEYFEEMAEVKHSIMLGFHKLESILGEKLPNTAYSSRQWWGNELSKVTQHVQAKAWLSAGWEVDKVDLDGEAVLFRKVGK